MPNDVIKLNLINQSNDLNNSQVLIFQKNIATTFDEIAVAWQVIENLGHGWEHPFDYPLDLEVSACDSYGNYVPPKPTADGKSWKVIRDSSGDQLKENGSAASHTEVEVVNGLDRGAICAKIYRSGALLSMKSGVAPMQKAVFQFKPSIFIGVVSQVQRGEVLNSAILSSVNTQLNLYGVASADIVMTGGGPGRASMPFSFGLENVRYM